MNTVRVYKFYPANWALEAIKKQRLKVSPVGELNDPFEYLSVDIGRRDVRKWMQKLHSLIVGGNGIISFSRAWNEPLMWAHYADNHKGIALGFDIPKHMLFEINYIENRIKPTIEVDHSEHEMEKLLDLVLRSKHKNWEYEGEFRLLRKLENCIMADRLYFSKLNEVTVLKEVVFGDRYESQDELQLQKKLKNEGVDFTTARPEFTGFKMTPQKLESKLKTL